MLVTHLLQVLGFVAMEPPTSFEAKALVDETVKVFEAMTPLRPEDVVRGQYRGYRDTPGVSPDSDTETFVAARVHIDNWRWVGVPFYLRTGKRLAEGRRVVTITFRDPPRRMFGHVDQHGPNQLVFELTEPGGISSSFLAKVPGPEMRLGPARFSFRYEDAFSASCQLEAYERLIHDALLGDETLFTRADGVERLFHLRVADRGAELQSWVSEPSTPCRYTSDRDAGTLAIRSADHDHRRITSNALHKRLLRSLRSRGGLHGKS
jgi:glucose-6-phosphate 1-dehydrogenase